MTDNIHHTPTSRSLTYVAVAALLAATTSCRSDSDSTPTRHSPRPRGFIAVVGVGVDDTLWPVLQGSAQRTFNELHGSTQGLSLRVVAPPRRSVNLQRQLIETMQDEEMVGICVQVTDPCALETTLRSLASRGVKVVTMMERPTNKSLTMHAGINERVVGTAMANALLAATARPATVAILHSDAVNRASKTRHRAAITRLASEPGVSVLLEFDCGQDPTHARSIIRDTTMRYPRLSGWIVTGDWPLRNTPNKPSDKLLGSCIVAFAPPVAELEHFNEPAICAIVVPRYDLVVGKALTACVGAVLGESSRGIEFFAPVDTYTIGEFDEFKKQWQRWCSPSPG